MKTKKRRRVQAVYSNLAIERKWAAITCVWHRLEVDRGVGEIYSETGSFRDALIEDHWPDEAVGGVATRRISCMLG